MANILQHSSVAATRKLFNFLGIETSNHSAGSPGEAVLDQKVMGKKKTKVKVKRKKSKKKKFASSDVVPVAAGELRADTNDEMDQFNEQDDGDCAKDPENGEDYIEYDDKTQRVEGEFEISRNEEADIDRADRREYGDVTAVHIESKRVEANLRSSSPKAMMRSKVLERYTGKLPYSEPLVTRRASPSKLQVYLASKHASKNKPKPPAPKAKPPAVYHDAFLSEDRNLFERFVHDGNNAEGHIIPEESWPNVQKISNRNVEGRVRRPKSAAPKISQSPAIEHKAEAAFVGDPSEVSRQLSNNSTVVEKRRESISIRRSEEVRSPDSFARVREESYDPEAVYKNAYAELPMEVNGPITTDMHTLSSRNAEDPIRRPLSGAPQRSTSPTERNDRVPDDAYRHVRRNAIVPKEEDRNLMRDAQSFRPAWNDSTVVEKRRESISIRRSEEVRSPDSFARVREESYDPEAVYKNEYVKPHMEVNSTRERQDVSVHHQQHERRPEPATKPPPFEFLIPNPESPSKVTVTETSVLDMNPLAVYNFLLGAGFGYYAQNFLDMGVWGEDLLMSDDADLQACGVVYKPHRRKLNDILDSIAAGRRSRMAGRAHYEGHRAPSNPGSVKSPLISPHVEHQPLFRTVQTTVEYGVDMSPRRNNIIARSSSDGAILKNQSSISEATAKSTIQSGHIIDALKAPESVSDTTIVCAQVSSCAQVSDNEMGNAVTLHSSSPAQSTVQSQEPKSALTMTQDNVLDSKVEETILPPAQPVTQDVVPSFQESLKSIDSKLFFDMLAKALKEDLSLLVTQQKNDTNPGLSTQEQLDSGNPASDKSSEGDSNKQNIQRSEEPASSSNIPSSVPTYAHGPEKANFTQPNSVDKFENSQDNDLDVLRANRQDLERDLNVDPQFASLQDLQDAYYAHNSEYGSFGAYDATNSTYQATPSYGYEYDPHYYNAGHHSSTYDTWPEQTYDALEAESAANTYGAQESTHHDPNYSAYYHASQHMGSLVASQYESQSVQYGDDGIAYQEPYYHSVDHYYEPSIYSIPSQGGSNSQVEDAYYASHGATASEWPAAEAEVEWKDQEYTEVAYDYSNDSQPWDSSTVRPLENLEDISERNLSTEQPESIPSSYVVQLNPTLQYDNQEENVNGGPYEDYSINPYGIYDQFSAYSQQNQAEEIKPSSLRVDALDEVDGLQAPQKTVRWDENTIGSKGSKIDVSGDDIGGDAVSLDSASHSYGFHSEVFDGDANQQSEELSTKAPIDPEFNVEYNPFMDLSYGGEDPTQSDLQNGDQYFLDPYTNELYDANNTAALDPNSQGNYYAGGDDQAQQAYWSETPQPSLFNGGYLQTQDAFAPQYQQPALHGYEANAIQSTYPPSQAEDSYLDGQFGAYMDPFVDDDPTDFDPNYYNDASEQYAYDPNAYQQNYYGQGGGTASVGSNPWGVQMSAKQNDSSLFLLAMGGSQ
jgi:hypothetical protein